MERLVPYITFDHRGSKYIVNGNHSLKLSNQEWNEFRKDLFPFAASSQFSVSDFKGAVRIQKNINWAKKNRLNAASLKNSPISSSDFIFLGRAAVQTWKYGIFTKNLKSAMRKKPAQFLFLIEMTWFVCQVLEYLLPAILAQPEGHLRDLLSKLLKDEAHHGKMLLRDLGLTKSQIAKHDAAPGSRMLVAYLRDLATNDPVSFLVSASLLEADEVAREGHTKFISKISRNLKLPLGGFKRHFQIDLEAEHSCLWELAISGFESIEKKRATKILNDIHVTRHALVAWYESIAFRCSEANEIGTGLKKIKASCFLRTQIGPEGFWLNS